MMFKAHKPRSYKFWLWLLFMYWYIPSILFFIVGRSPGGW